MHSLDKDVLITADIKELMISQEKVAHVQLGNPLEHALLVLIKSGYSAIPVLDTEYKLHGLISKTLILDSILGIETIEVEKLSVIKVEDAMNKDVPRLKQNDEFIKALGLAINNAFVCIVDEAGLFAGILTRRAILKWFTKHLNSKN